MAFRLSRVLLQRRLFVAQPCAKSSYFNSNTFTKISSKVSANATFPRFYSNQVNQDPQLTQASKFAREGKHEQALELYESYLQKNPNSVAIQLNKALTLSNLGRFNETLAACETAAKINLEDFGVAGFLIYGNAYLGLDKVEEALEAYTEGLKIDNKNIILLFNRATTLEKLRRYEGSITCYQEILKIDPKNLETCLRLSNIYLNRRQGRDALRFANKAIDIEPQNTVGHLYKGHAFVIVEQFENSLIEYDVVIDFLEQKLKQSDIEGPGERETLLDAYLGKANAYAFMMRFGESIHFYDKVLKKEPKNMKALVSKSYTLYQLMGRPMDALESVEQILAIEPAHQFANVLQKAIVSKIPDAAPEEPKS